MHHSKLIGLLLVVLSFFVACGGSSDSPPTFPEVMDGRWAFRLYAPYTSCSTDDLGDYAGDGFTENLDVVYEEIGELGTIDLISDDGSSAKYDITSVEGEDPLTMTRFFNTTSKGCTWNYERAYTLTMRSKNEIVGRQRNDVTSSPWYCEECFYTLETEFIRME